MKKKIDKMKKNNQTEEPEEKQSIISRFIEYDDRVIRKKMIPHWPQVKEDNNNISRKIKKALGIWAEQKEKSHTYKENDTIGIDLPGFNKNWKRDENEEELDKRKKRKRGKRRKRKTHENKK